MTALNLNCQILIVGGGAAGIATAASLLARDASLQITLVDPADTHYYQPGWTMVGAGVFEPQSTARSMASLIPKGVQWIKAAVATFEPQDNALTLEDGRSIGYQQLVVCPGLKLDWAAIDGLVDTLGANGVTSNYRYDLAPYTWKLVQGPETRPGVIHSTSYADQMRGCAAESPVPVLRSLAQSGSSRADQRTVLQRRWRVVRRGGLCAGADDVH